MISSASISLRPRPNRCGASRLSGLVTTSPPTPAEPSGRPWQAAQLSARPAPMVRSRLDVARAVAGQRTLALDPRELALEDLAAAADRPGGVAVDDEEGGVWRLLVAAAGTDLLLVRLGDAGAGGVGRLGPVDHLGPA